MARPPLRLIADEAGVSEPTVSRVLNGRTGVAPATRDRVATREIPLDATARAATRKDRGSARDLVAPRRSFPLPGRPTWGDGLSAVATPEAGLEARADA